MNENDLSGAIEALLFVYGEAMSIKKAANILAAEEERVLEAAEFLRAELEGRGGLRLLVSGGEVQLVTKPEFSERVKALVREEMNSELSPASLETLAIIAYLGPVSRAEIDYIRGVNSSFILRSLSIRGLVGRKSSPKHAGTFTYQASMEFLKHIGLDTENKLPEYEKYRDLLGSLREENKQESPAKIENIQDARDGSAEKQDENPVTSQ